MNTKFSKSIMLQGAVGVQRVSDMHKREIGVNKCQWKSKLNSRISVGSKNVSWDPTTLFISYFCTISTLTG